MPPAPAGLPQRTIEFRSPTYGNFAGGLNTRDYWHTLKDNELTVARNIRLDEGGVIRKRGGWAKYISSAVGSAGNLKGVFQGVWVSAGTVIRAVIATDGVTVWYESAGAWANITGAVVLTTTNAALNSFVLFNNLLIGHDGVNAPWQWDGAAAAISTLAGSPPVGNISIVWQSRLWFAGVGTAQTRLYYSDVNDPAVWGASSFIDVPSTFDGDPITGLAVLYGNLIIFKRNSIYIIQGDAPSNFVVSKTNSAVGCVSPYSVVSVDNLVYFVSDKGLYAMNLSNTKHLAYKVEPNYTRAVKNQLLSSLARNRIQGIHYRAKNEVWFAIDSTAAGQDQHDRVIAHNYAIVDPDSGDPAVTEHTMGGAVVAPAVFADYRDPGTGTIAPIASFYDKFVYYFTETATNDATAAATANFSSAFLTGYKDFGDAQATKTLKNIWTSLVFAAGTPTITIGLLSADFTAETVATLTPASPSTFYNVKQPAGTVFTSARPQGKYFKFGMTSADGGTFSFFQAAFDVVNNGRRN